MISVTGYCNGSPLVYGRGETEKEARKNAEALADEVGRQFPRLWDPRCWEYKRDTVDRQLFASGERGNAATAVAIAKL